MINVPQDPQVRLRLEGLSKRYADGSGVGPVDLELSPGQRLVLLGPSGSGKTTLLRLLAGVETPDSGTIWLDEVDVTNLPAEKRHCFYFPQRTVFYPGRSVHQQLTLVADHVDPNIVTELALDELLPKQPTELSGGEKQRVFWAKWRLKSKKLGLFDEPFSSIDSLFLWKFRAELLLLFQQKPATIIVATHNLMDAWSLGQLVGVLQSGLLRQIDSPERLLQFPRHRAVAAALNQWNLIEGSVVSSAGEPQKFVSECGSIKTLIPKGLFDAFDPRDHLLHQKITLGIRIEDIQIGSTPSHESNNLPILSTILVRQPIGGIWLVTVAVGSLILQLQHVLPPPETGSQIPIHLNLSRGLWFQADGTLLRKS